LDYYTFQGAQDKVGRRVRVIIPFGDAVKGANGKVVEISLGPGGYSLAIEWDWPPGPTPLITTVSKAEYEGFLLEL